MVGVLRIEQSCRRTFY